jgi:hypothetical protein
LQCASAIRVTNRRGRPTPLSEPAKAADVLLAELCLVETHVKRPDQTPARSNSRGDELLDSPSAQRFKIRSFLTRSWHRRVDHTVELPEWLLAAQFKS